MVEQNTTRKNPESTKIVALSARPCGREDGISSNPDLLSNKNLHSSNPVLMPDENLYALCKSYGERARIWRQRFAGLLPEVFKRGLYEKKGFFSIFEFAKKLAGMSEEQVRLVLNLEKRFEQTPALKTLLTSGKVRINKLARIVSIAKPENEIFLATQVQFLSKNAVETLVRDEKFAMENAENFSNTMVNFEKQKGLDINALLKEFLQKREEEIMKRKNKIVEEMAQKQEQKRNEVRGKKKELAQKKSPSRHIPIAVKRILHLEYGTKCSIKKPT